MSLIVLLTIQSLMLLGVSILFTLIGKQIEAKYEHSASLLVVYGLLVVYMCITATLIFPFLFIVVEWVVDRTNNSIGPSLGATGSRAIVQPMMYFDLLLAFPGLVMMSRLAFGTTVDFVLSALYDSTVAGPMPSDFSRAKAHAKQGNATAATVQYWKYYREDPKRPRPLFAGARYTVSEKRYDAARKFYEEIRKSFSRNTGVWAEASMELAELLHHYLGDSDGARDILVEVRRRARRYPQGRLASERLAAQFGHQLEDSTPARD